MKSALQKNGYEVTVIDGWLNDLTIEEVYQKILNVGDILYIGISSYMSNTESTIQLIKKLKQYDENIKIICGGFGPTFYPEDHLKSGADIVSRGEGEETLVEIANALANNNPLTEIENISYKQDGIIIHNPSKKLLDNLDLLPFPSREMVPIILKKKSTVNMLTSRGCSGNCEFCSVISFFRKSEGKIWRTRSIQNIVDEIEELYKMGVKYIKVVDDSFIDGSRDEVWAEEFADEIQKRNIKVMLRGQIRADKVNEKILFHLKRAGFFSFACGIENGSETALKRMNKKATLLDNKKALELFKKYEYLVQMGYILFDKDTTLEELEENFNFLNEYDFAVTKGIFSEMYSAEGTKLNNKLRQNGSLKESDFINNNNKYTITDEKVNLVYLALKLWHKSHSKIYDMAIDPLSAPKAINDEDRKLFYDQVMKLKQKDLIFFKKILELVKKDILNPEEYTKLEVLKNQEFYDTIESDIIKLYKKSRLNYIAEENPFI